MYLFEPLVFCLLVGSISAQQSRRVGIRVRPSVQEEVAAQEEQEFYTEEDEQPIQRPVQFRQPALGRAIASQPRIQATAPRQKNVQDSKPPPVQTIRNYNKLNDDGSFTFGYEAADGSFKEENRGTDCVVRGKYGYIDPDGNKREFTYVSGNPCDPNADKQEQEEEPDVPAGSAEENVPANYPQRPLKASRRPPPPERPSTTLFQQQFVSNEEAAADEEEEQRQVNIRPRPTIRPTPQFTTVEQQPQVFRAPSPTPRPTFAPQPSRAPTVRFQQPPATTFRPQIQVTSNAPVARPQASASPQPGGLDFSAEFKKFQIDLEGLNPSRAGPKPASPSSQPGSSSALYQTELVFDPATGQYNTVVYQQVPKAVDVPQRSPFSAQPQPQPQFFSPPRQQFSQPPPSAFQQQQLFQQQQAALQVQQSQQLFEQQQEQKRATEAPRIPQTLLRQSPQTFSSPPAQSTPTQRFQPEPQQQRFLSDAPSQRFNPVSGRSQRFPSDAPPSPSAQRFSQPSQPQNQPFFFVASPSDRQTFASGQIDTFLRGHNLQF